MYSIDKTTGAVTRDSDGHQVAPCQSSSDPDFVAYIDWANAGNHPTEIQSIAIDPVAYTNAVQDYLDTHAQSRGWDSIYTAALRASFAGPWQSEGILFAQWMDACWLKCHSILNDVHLGIRPIPTIEQVFLELPAIPIF